MNEELKRLLSDVRSLKSRNGTIENRISESIGNLEKRFPVMGINPEADNLIHGLRFILESAQLKPKGMEREFLGK
ncbi:hypothetical protein KAR91_50425 [Candidatus Pacearchaeota archaeon]|nr:hypothetical protein [Candidatus Pacearchaeota archaeon]